MGYKLWVISFRNIKNPILTPFLWRRPGEEKHGFAFKPITNNA